MKIFAILLLAAAATSEPAFVRVEPGTFVMGSSRDDEGSPRAVRSERPFLLMTTEVTRGLWRRVMSADAGYFTACGDSCPVESVSWDDAIAFCNAWSRLAGLAPAYEVSGAEVRWLADADGYRLPTEAEWEYACRAGTTTPFASGDCLDANYNAYHPPFGCPAGPYRQEPVAVGSFAPNAWGLHDMHGNVAEWCWDAYAPYGEAAPDDTVKCYRGGSWRDGAVGCRSSVRYSLPRAQFRDDLGLRVARTLVGS